MKEIVIRIACLISIILIVAASGCVAPPKENTPTTKSGNIKNSNQPTTQATATPNYVTEVTPFATTTPISGLQAIPTTQPPGELYCRIYSTTNIDNTTAIVFDLKNPPMYINYTVKPSNVTEKRVVTKWEGEGTSMHEVEKEIKIDTYSPASTFVIKVMNKGTGEIYLQDGFGTRQYTTYLNRTLKILNRDELQVEFRAINMTAKAMVWVKPEGNFNDTMQFNRTTDCAYFSASPRDVLVIATTKTTATPTYRLQ